jgi:hypothetical protein
MKYARELVLNTVIGGALVLVPIYLAVLVLLKGMQPVVSLVRYLRAYPGRASGSRAGGAVVLWKNSRLRAVSQPDAADGWGG